MPTGSPVAGRQSCSGWPRRIYDFVILDTPPAFTEHVLAAFDASDVSILLATLDIPAIKNLRLTLDTLDLLGHAREQPVIVLNRSDAKVGLTAEDVHRRPAGRSGCRSPTASPYRRRSTGATPIVLDEPRHAVSRPQGAAPDHVGRGDPRRAPARTQPAAEPAAASTCRS